MAPDDGKPSIVGIRAKGPIKRGSPFSGITDCLCLEAIIRRIGTSVLPINAWLRHGKREYIARPARAVDRAA